MNKSIIFTDGASRGNPGPGGWAAVVMEAEVVAELGGREEHTTNNRMELMGAIKALQSVQSKTVTLNTDSRYLINGITKWVFGWQKNNWKTQAKEEVLNRDLWEALIIESKKRDIAWNYVGGHSGIPANERCDEIATTFADNRKIELYKGSLKDYPLDISEVTADAAKKEKRASSRSRSNTPAYSYMSLIDGKIQTYKTWAECEKQVKGKSGVKFKKALSKEEEARIRQEWLS